MEEHAVYLEEDEDEFDEDDSILEIKRCVVEFVLRRFGLLSAADIARALEWKVKDVNQVLKNLEGHGRVKRAKLGRSYVWAPVDERYQTPMHY
jgi:DNA-binding MarR family transcriptional regulator